jgi:hypothetical protein
LAPSGTGIGTMMLLSDGTVMAQGGNIDKTWYSLTPNAAGNYVSGTWSARASMAVQRLYFGSNILTDGRVFVVGGEYSSDGGFSHTGEIYNPVTNTWTGIANFPQSQFGDDPTEVLPDGSVLGGYVVGPQTYIYHPTTNTWTQTGTKLRNDQSDEEAWIKLPDNSILSYDVFSSISSGVGHAQRYVPSDGTWHDTSNVPGPVLTSSGVGFEMGPGLLLPDGRVFQIGANNHTAYYTPSTNTWTTGPDIPNNGAGQLQGADDAPAAVLPNGKILMAVDHPLFNGPTTIYEFDPLTNTYTNVTPPSTIIGESGPSYINRMLVLPTGQVLLTNSGTQLAVYTPDGSANASWKPTVSGVVDNGDGTFTLTGTQLNGLSEGANYGDDAEMSSNYPIVRLTDSAGGVHYARTFNWSSTGVATGGLVETVKFQAPAGVNVASSTLNVVANGITSDAFFLGLRVSSAVPASGAGSVASVRVTFNEAIQPATFTADQAVLKGPGSVTIPVTISAVAGSNNTQFDLAFAQQTTLGLYTLTVGPNIKDGNGMLMDQDGDGVGGSVPDDQFVGTFALNGPQVTASSAFLNHVRLTFNEPVDPNTLTPDQAVSFTGPAGAIDLSDATLSAVSGTNNTQVDVTFDPQSAPGNYNLTVGPAIADLFGHQMDQNGNFIPGEVPGDQYHALWTIVLPKINTDSGITHGGSYLPGALSSVHEVVTFNVPMDPATFTPDQVTITGPGLPYTADSVTAVAGSNNTQFSVSFTANATGAYTMAFGPNIADPFGNVMAAYPAIPFNVLGPKITTATGIILNGTYQPGALSSVHEVVTFNEPMDPATFTPDQVVLNGPGLPYTADSVTAVAGTNNTQFSISFTANVTGHYTMVIGPSIADPFGNVMAAYPAIPFNVSGPKGTSGQVQGDFTNNVYSGVRVFFNEPMDPTSFTLDQFTLKGPGNVTIPVTAVTPVAGTSAAFDVSFAAQGKIGNYTLTVGPNLLDTFGNAMDQNGNFITGEVPGDQFTFAFTVVGPKVNSAAPLPGNGEPVNTVRVTFSKPMDVTTFTPAKVVSFSGPNGPIGIDGIFAVPGSNFQQFDLVFKPQTSTGSYTLTIGPDIRDQSGNQMDQNGNLIAGEVPGDRFTTSFIMQGLRITTPANGDRFLPGTDHVRLTFNAPVDPVSFTTGTIVSFSTPDGPVAVTSVTPVPYTDYTQYDVGFPVQGTTGPYTLVVGPTMRDMLGNKLDQNGNLIPGEIPGDDFTYNFGIQGLRVLASDPSGGAGPPVDHVRFTFNEPVDPNTFTTDQVVSFAGPSGAIAVTGVTQVDSAGLVFDVTFAPQSALGTYTMVIGPNILDLFTNAMDQNNNLVPGEIPGDRYTAQFTLSLINNPGFETGNFTGWTTLGNDTIKTAAYGTGPTEGTFDALITGGGIPVSTIESFMGVAAGSLNGLGNGQTFDGSALKQTINVSAGQTLKFDWNFLTNESTSSTNPFNDFAWVSLKPASGSGFLGTLASTHTPGFVAAPPQTGFASMTGFKTFSFTFTTGGSYVMSVGAVNVGDTAFPSGLLVDHFQITSGAGPSSSPPGPSGQGPDPAIVTIHWDGEARQAFAGQWFMHLNGLPGNTRAVQLQAAQQLMAAAGVESDIQAIDHAGTDGNILLQVPDDMVYASLMYALRNVPGLGYVEPYFADDGAHQTLFWADDNDVLQQGGGVRAPAGPAGPAAPLPPSGPGNLKILNAFEGINFSQSGGWTPPDTDGVVGPTSFIENVNSSLAIYNKATGAAIAGPTGVNTFWAPEGESAFFSDPVAVYDEFAQKFVLVEGNFNNNHVFVAVSKTSNPTALDTNNWSFFKYTLNDGTGLGMDYPKIGYNQDGYVLSYNMFSGFYDHSTTLSIRKSDMAGFVNKVSGGFSHFTLAPATMHTSSPGDPMWFVEDGHTGGGGSTVNVVKMTNPFSSSPTFTTTALAVTPYSDAPNPRQPGGSLGGRTSLGTRFFFSGLRQVGNQTLLVSADAVGANGGSQVRWYEFDVAPAAPTLVQQGAIDQGAGVDTFYPDVDIAPGGLLGMTFDQSSSTAPSGYLSMYVTGRIVSDPTGTMQTPVLARQGIGFLNAGGRGGDYSFTSIDPTDGTFWATNEYAPQNLGSNWNWATYVAHFQVAPPAGPSVIAQVPAASIPGQVSSVRLTFDESIDTTTFTTAKIVSFTGPGGTALTVTGISAVSGTNNTQFDLTFAPQTALGVYTLVLGPDIRDTLGHQMDQNHNGVPGEIPGDRYTGTFSVQGLKVTASTPTGTMLPSNVNHVRLTFNEPVDPTTLTADQLVSFTGPAGLIDLSSAAFAVVAGTNNTQVDVTFPAQSATGNYSLVIGPGIMDLFGHQMDQNGNSIDGEVPGDEYTATWTLLGPKITAATGITPGASYLPGALSTVTEVVTFNEPMDPTGFFPQDAHFTGPNGSFSADSVTVVAGSNNTQFAITFTANATGHYTLAIGPNIPDPFGNYMDQNGNLITGEIPGDQYILTFNVLGPKVTASQTLGDTTNSTYSAVRLTFNEPMDVTSFTPDQLTLKGPGNVTIPIASVTPVGSSNTTFDLGFALQGKLGNYTLTVGPNLLDLFGNAMDQNGNFITGEVPGDQFTLTFTVVGPKILSAVPLPGGGTEPVNTLRVTFSKPMDVTTFTPAKVASFSGPNGPIGIDGIYAVPGSNFQQFDLVFKPQKAPGVAYVQSLDDGSSEERFNNSQSNDTEDNWVANSFQVAAGGDILTSVSFQLGENYTNRAISVLIYTGSSLTNPHAGSGLTLVSETDTTFSGTSGGFVTIPLNAPLTLPLGQVYWAAVLMRGVPSTQFPFQNDKDAPKGRSWFDVGPTKGGAYNVNDTSRATVLGGSHPVVGLAQSAGNLILRVNTEGTSYKMVLGPDIRDQSGNKLDQNGNLIAGEIPGDQFTAFFSVQGLRITTPASGDRYVPGTDHVRLTFNAPVDPSTFTTGTILSLTGPNGPITVTAVTPVPYSDYTQYDVFFDPSAATATGPYTLVVAPTMQDLQGNLLDQNNNGVPGEIPGDDFTYNFGVSGLRVVSSDPAGGVAPGVNHVRFTFNEPVDPTTFTTASVVSFTGPSGAITVTGVTQVDSAGLVFDVTFAPQTTLGNYTMVIGPNILDLFGNAMDQNNNLVPGEIPGDRYTAQFTVSVINNPSFETGDFTGWTTLGNDTIKTSAYGTGPTDGVYDALITGGGIAVATIESFMGVAAGSLNGLGNGTTFDGSALKQTINVSAGQTLKFDWNFLTNEQTSSTNPFNDFAFVSLKPTSGSGFLATLASTHTPGFVAAPPQTGFASMTGFKTFSFTFTTGGSYVLSVGAVNVGDTAFPSGLLVDNFRITTGAGPSSTGGTGPGGSGGGNPADTSGTSSPPLGVGQPGGAGGSTGGTVKTGSGLSTGKAGGHTSGHSAGGGSAPALRTAGGRGGTVVGLTAVPPGSGSNAPSGLIVAAPTGGRVRPTDTAFALKAPPGESGNLFGYWLAAPGEGGSDSSGLNDFFPEPFLPPGGTPPLA